LILHQVNPDKQQDLTAEKIAENSANILTAARRLLDALFQSSASCPKYFPPLFLSFLFFLVS